MKERYSPYDLTASGVPGRRDIESAMRSDRENNPAIRNSPSDSSNRNERTLPILEPWMDPRNDRYNGRQFVASATTRAKMNKLAASYDEAIDSKKYTPEELQQIRGEIEQGQQGIAEGASLRVPEPSLADKFKQKTYTDSGTGQIFPVEADGRFGKPIYSPAEKGLSWKDTEKLAKLAMNTDANGKQSIDFDQLKKLVSTKGELDSILRGDAPQEFGGAEPQRLGQQNKIPIASADFNKQIKTQGGTMASPKSKKDYDAMPSGSLFVDPNGTMRRKT